MYLIFLEETVISDERKKAVAKKFSLKMRKRFFKTIY